eukprot:NODE_1916_length_1357_cov_24.694190_g1735_i0.p1 GENE.NODE_1916_length_1357_cov_24.694190_g1735_i0~~NODE_1916_length_1357_cov_24.694190_g1735_i0.p1  ORF type:complete len:309 (+),score=47.21 NODE_1916_length_1357_cov_24.694190_g1735_i0:93-1019(+)
MQLPLTSTYLAPATIPHHPAANLPTRSSTEQLASTVVAAESWRPANQPAAAAAAAAPFYTSRPSQMVSVPAASQPVLLTAEPFTPLPLSSVAPHAPQNALSHGQLQHLVSQFQSLDRDHDGQLSYREFGDALEVILGQALTRSLFRVESRGGQFITLPSFLSCMRLLLVAPPEEKLAFAFRVFDLDGSGYIDLTEFAFLVERVLLDGLTPSSESLSDVQLARMFASADRNRNGQISESEFVSCMLASGALPVHHVPGEDSLGDDPKAFIKMGSSAWCFLMPLLKGIQMSIKHPVPPGPPSSVCCHFDC